MPKRPRNSDEFQEAWERVIAPLEGDGAEVDAGFGIFQMCFEKLLAAGFVRDDALRIIAYGLFHTPDKGENE